MALTTPLTTVRAEISAAEQRTTVLVATVQALLSAGIDSAAAERTLFRELDGSVLLRERLRTIETLRDYHAAA